MRQRLLNDSLARLLHDQLHKRMIDFCEHYTPEFPAEPIVQGWLNRLYQGDKNLHILVTLDDNYKIVGHGVIDVQEAYGYRVVYCHQAQGDKNSEASLDLGVEYVTKLVNETNAYCSIFVVAKHVRSLEKKYGYKDVRTVMMKVAVDD